MNSWDMRLTKTFEAYNTCLPWAGKILIDYVWSGGMEEEAEKFESLENFAMDEGEKKRRVEATGKAVWGKVENYFKTGIIGEIGEKIMMDLQLFAEKDIRNQESASLKRSIRKFRKRIEEHEHKISHPEEHFPKWDSYGVQRQEGLKRHWKKEIRNFRQSISDREEELKKRGDDDGQDIKQ